MTTLVYSNIEDGPGPILVDHMSINEDDYVVHGAYGMTPLHRSVGGATVGYAHASFTWAQATPFEFTLIFTQRNGRTVTWTIARELMRSGGGEGDINVVQLGDQMAVTLDSPSGRIVFSLDAPWVDRLLDATDDIVPAADEMNGVKFPDGGVWR
ncbi:SsgA family sporulation/cell division regulator [Amycolatopsis sp. NPDC004378]